MEYQSIHSEGVEPTPPHNMDNNRLSDSLSMQREVTTALQCLRKASNIVHENTSDRYFEGFCKRYREANGNDDKLVQRTRR